MSTPKRVALVTGATGGIGSACCAALAAEGFTVAAHYHRNLEAADRLTASLDGSFALRADLGDPRQVETMVDEIEASGASVEVLVNNAGFTIDAPMATAKLEDLESISAIGRGTWLLTKLILRRFMIAARSGRIINISSVVAHTGNPGQTAYAMQKSGVEAMTRALALEVRNRGILVNTVAPGFVDTAMTRDLPDKTRSALLDRIPLRRFGTAEEVADVVAFLATRGDYIQGSVLHVNGGMYGG